MTAAHTLEITAHRDCAEEAREDAAHARNRARDAVDPADQLRHLEHAERWERVAAAWDGIADRMEADAT